ncbi:hypothetical protein BDN70DRAFT_870261 [Pholiota conissans]|uniref:Uncharacterized protein n=1 Tax=Pholiota conissans TaxID=109636 RepID=A0A9P5ZDQ5_9AGAR|nr:hypothetical protein BDN70DRAFT_870261 [Pholiota conissans]
MESEKSRPFPILPPNIINILMANLVHGKNDITGARLTRLERRDLAACGLVSSSFYLPSRRYLFSTLTINLDLCNSPTNEIPLSRDGLIGIMSGNSALQDLVHHLVITYMDPRSENWIRPAEGCRNPRGDDLQHVLRLLPAVRKLTISTSQSDYVTVFNRVVGTIIEGLDTSCPHLRSLALFKLEYVPIKFIHHWTNVTDLQLHDVSFAKTGLRFPGDEDDNEVYRIQGGDGFNFETAFELWKQQGIIDTPSLERLHLRGGMFFPDRLRISINHHQLRHLLLTFVGTSQYIAEHDVDLLVRKVAPKLTQLSLKDAFYYAPNWIELLTENVIRNVKILDISETDIIHLTPFPFIAQFLTPKNLSTTSSLEHISILVRGAGGNMTEVFKHDPGWLDLDALWTGPQYQHLVKIDIRLVFTAVGSEKAVLRLKDKAQALMERIENASYRLLPLVSCLSRIKLHFSVEVHSLTRYIAWDNHTGRSSNFTL